MQLKPPNKSAPALRIAHEAEALFGIDGVGLAPDTLDVINGDLADHGVAIGYNVPTARDDGSRVDFTMRAWPLEHVSWDSFGRQLQTLVEYGETSATAVGQTRYGYMPIVHGDGRWVVFRKRELDPWAHRAAILSGSMVFAAHSTAMRDWAKSSSTHGNAKVVGEMPPDVDLTNADGSLTDEATGFLALIDAIADLGVPRGIRPAGSKIDYIVNDSRAWEVWDRLVTNSEKVAARIYLGTDGMLGSVGGAPGVDIATLFGVATTIVQGDLSTIERGILTGVIEPWCAINFGDSSLAPKRVYMLPDADADAERRSYAERSTAFWADVAAARENGFALTQSYVERLAARYDVEPPQLPEPALAAGSAPASGVDAPRLSSVA